MLKHVGVRLVNATTSPCYKSSTCNYRFYATLVELGSYLIQLTFTAGLLSCFSTAV